MRRRQVSHTIHHEPRWRTVPDVPIICYVSMPNGPPFDRVFDLAVEPAIADAGFDLASPNNIRISDSIDFAITAEIERASIVVADVSRASPSVFYEMGIAQGQRKPLVIIAANLESVPRDLLHQRIITYGLDDRGLRELRRNLTDTIRRSVVAPARTIAFRSESPAQRDTVLKTLEKAYSDYHAGDPQQAAVHFKSVVESAVRGGDTHLAAVALNGLGYVYQSTGELDAALSALQEAFERTSSIEDPRLRLAITTNLANVVANTGDLSRSRYFLEDGLQQAHAIGDDELTASVLANFAHVLSMSNDFTGSERAYQEALATLRAINSPDMAKVEANLAAVMLQQGRHSEAQRLLLDAAAQFQIHGDQAGRASVLHNLGSVLQRMGDLGAAERYLVESLQIKEQLGDRGSAALSLANLAGLAGVKGDLEHALELFARAAAIQEEIGDRLGLAQTLFNLGILAQRTENTESSVAFLERSLGLAESLRSPLADQIRSALEEMRLENLDGH